MVSRRYQSSWDHAFPTLVHSQDQEPFSLFPLEKLRGEVKNIWKLILVQFLSEKNKVHQNP